MLRRDFLKYLALSSAFFLGCAGKAPSSTPAPTPTATKMANLYKSTFVLGYGKDHKLNGGKWGIGFFPKIHVLERLVEYDLKKDDFVPCLARKWEVEKNGKVITFELEKGIKFSDGSDFDASAVKFTVEWLKLNHPLGRDTFDSAEVLDDGTVAIHYKEDGFFNLAKMAEFHMSIMSPKSVRPEGDPKGKFILPVGTGQFRVADYKEGRYAIYEPNEYWYERFGIEPKFRKFVVDFIFDDDTRVMALESGQVDAISDYVHGGSAYTPRNLIPQLEKMGYRVFKRIIPLTWIIAFNYKKEPFSDVRMREAVDLAIDRNEVVKIFDNQVLPAKTLFIESAPGIKEAGVVYEYNPDRAKELVEKAGFDSADMIVDKAQSDQILVAQLVQQKLKDIGINVKLEVLETGAYRQRRDSGDYDLRIYYIGGTDRRFYLRMYWRFYPGCKWSAYVSERTGELCKKILKEFDEEKRKKYLVEFYRAIHEEHGVVPLYFDVMTVAVSKNVVADEYHLFHYPNGIPFGEPLFYDVGVRA